MTDNYTNATQAKTFRFYMYNYKKSHEIYQWQKTTAHLKKKNWLLKN